LTLLAFLLVSCKIEGKLTILFEGMTVELEVIPSSTVAKLLDSSKIND
jgi:hypothetical protein